MIKIFQDRISVSNLVNRRFKSLVLIAFLILVWIGLIKLISSCIIANVDEDWNEILAEKTISQEETCTRLFNSYQNEVSEYSDKISKNVKIRKYIISNDVKKIYDTIFKLNLPSSVQLEVYNTRLELLVFKGRQLEPEFVLLQKALAGNKVSVIKDIGFYTYCLLYSPIRSLGESENVIGVSLTAELIDIKYQITNKFFQDFGLSNDIENAIKITPELIAANTISGDIQIDSVRLIDKEEVDLMSIDGKVIGKILIPTFDKASHIRNISSLSAQIISVLLFIFSLIITFLVFKTLNLFESLTVRLILFGIFLILIRYLWLQFDFPSKTFESELFSPSYYASSFGFGIVKSIGELFVTSVFLLVFVLYIAKQTFVRTRLVSTLHSNLQTYFTIFINVLLTVLFFVLMNIYE